MKRTKTRNSHLIDTRNSNSTYGTQVPSLEIHVHESSVALSSVIDPKSRGITYVLANS